MLCEHWKEKDSGISPKRFKLHPEKCSVSMKWKVNNKSVPQQIKGLRMTQFPVNSNIATTGHKLQGQTKKAFDCYVMELYISELGLCGFIKSQDFAWIVFGE